MQEKVLTKKKNGMLVLLSSILLLIAATVGCALGGAMMDEGKSPVLFIVSLIVLCLSWFPLAGLRVLKPQEALVLTLFGKYIGTIKGDGFYAINPFCVAVNPASKTQLNQSGDVKVSVGDALSSKSTRVW